VALTHESEGDESNKSFVLRLANARLTVTFTGLASDGKGFLAKRWIPEALMDAAKPDFLMGPTIERFAKRAIQRFKALSVAPPLDKRMSIIFAGYSYDESPPRCYFWMASNCERLEALCGQTLAIVKPSDEFFVSSIRDKRTSEEVFASLIAAGAEQAISDDSGKLLYEMVRQDKPADALVGKAVDESRRNWGLPFRKVGCTSLLSIRHSGGRRRVWRLCYR
jgi:hypothetical protein